MTIEVTYIEGNKEPFEETVRHFFSRLWNKVETNNITPVFLSPNGIDSLPADLTKEISQADINAKKASGLLLFESTDNSTRESIGNDSRTIESSVQITMYARSKYEMFLFIDQINDIIHENQPSSLVRIKKSNNIQDSAIAWFKERKGVYFSIPLFVDKEGFVLISTGTLTCMWVKTRID